MNVAELIKVLESIEDKTLPVQVLSRVIDGNSWAYKVEVSDTGDSGYEVSGEVRILGAK